MKYMFLLFDEEEDWEPTPEVLTPWGAFDEASAKLATQLAGEALEPSRSACVVRVRDGQTVVTDGPFIEGKEQLGGFFVFECATREIAHEIAAMIPTAPTGHIEVRPIVEFSEEFSN